jgi:quercetin dioxygenase-like cupin family protein
MSSDAAEKAEPADELAATLKRTETLHRSSSIPGRDIVQVRTEIPAGAQSGWHIHPPARRSATSWPGRYGWRSAARQP